MDRLHQSGELSVTIHSPLIDGDTVRFTWDDNLGGPATPEGGLFYRYEGIDLAQFSQQLWMEIFLSLRLRTYARLKRRVQINLPVAMPQVVVDFWLAYHHALQITISPTSNAESYSPWSDQSELRSHQDIDAAVYFGGGRDSLATACLLGEVYGRSRVLLIHTIDTGRADDTVRQVNAARFERLSLGPAREMLGFKTQRTWTNLKAIALAEGGKPNQPHVQQYTAGLLPVLLTYHPHFSTFCAGWFEYLIYDRPGRRTFLNQRSRPEMLAAQTRHYQRVLAFDHTVTNVNLLLNGVGALRLLAFRYPDALPIMMMCVQAPPGERWCYRCRKCARYGWHLLAEKIDDPRIDLNRLFSRNPWTLTMVEHARTFEGDVFPGEDAPWDSDFWHPLNSIAVGDLFVRADSGYAEDRLQGDAWFNFLIIKAMFGNRYQPLFHTAPAQVFALLPGNLGNHLKPIVAEVASIRDQGQEQLATSQGPAHGPFAFPFHHPLLDLPHLREAPA